MAECFITNQHAYTRVGCLDTGTGLRLFRASTSTVSIQIRTVGPTNERKHAARHNCFSNINLNSDDVDRLIEELTVLRQEIVRV